MKLDKVSKIVAEELGVKPYIVERINRIQWKFLRESIQKASPEPTSLIYIGKIHTNKRWIKLMQKKKESNESTE